MDVFCPKCQHEMAWRQGDYFCQHCQQTYQQRVECPDCGKPLQELKACGAVDYFCPNGHGMISKKRVVFSYAVKE
ncbi:zinc ribbon domain-containing protein [Hafnia alvei]|uniref:Zinc-ribbons n=1 Tax=Hafnia alvei TaxID=569 RepID=A0A1C6Z1M1_HAFAL|nr:zinc ribbon domain-containing protein [Hafnia alvei]NLS52633.1 primosomal protein N' (replication factor Y) - superfamily II helicase [Hafnia alvei]SCM53056.1 zinc-ribbons [Hafnia alvei]